MQYEEVEFTCEVCNKKVKSIRRKSNATKEFLCQQCGKKLINTE